MGRLGVFFCLVCVPLAAAQIDPRGARPVEHGTRADKCATQREWPFCTSDEWGPKCPSGCRIQGLMDKYDHGVLKGIEKIRKLLDQNSNKHRSADSVSKQTYDYIREKLVLDSGSSNNYQNLAQSLRQKITDMKIKIDRQMRILGALKDQVKDQVQEMQRMEVDIDIKLRSCKGSCSKYSEHQVDQESYVTLDKQMQQLDSTQHLETVGSLSVMKSRPLQDVIVESHFKSKDVDGTKTSSAQHKVNDVFTDVKTVSLVLEEEGSSSSPATVSKVPVCLRFNKPDGVDRWVTNRPLSPVCWDQKPRPLCSDHDWGSVCVSGCRLQALISHTENLENIKLKSICEKMKTNSERIRKSETETTLIYNQEIKVLTTRNGSYTHGL